MGSFVGIIGLGVAPSAAVATGTESVLGRDK